MRPQGQYWLRMHADLLQYGKGSFQCTVHDTVDLLGHAHHFEKSYITLHSGLGGYNIVKEGALGHSCRIWAITRSHQVHRWIWMSLLCLYRCVLMPCLSIQCPSLKCDANHPSDRFFVALTACSLTHESHHHLGSGLPLPSQSPCASQL